MALIVLALWPLLAPIFFARLPVASALVWATLLPYLFLPEAIAINVPSLPDIDKATSIGIGLLLGLMVAGRKPGLRRATPSPMISRTRLSWVFSALIIVYSGSIVASVLNNAEPLIYGPRFIPGLALWDIPSGIVGVLITLIPFLLARKYLATPSDQRVLLTGMVVMGLVYSLLMLVEIRLSPQLHRWFYGYHQHSFGQHIRDGYRPMVFLDHGLSVGFYMFTTVIAAIALWRSGGQRKWLIAALWLFAILSVSRNLGALAICVVMLGVLLLPALRMRPAILAGIAFVVLVFPAARQFQLVPTETLVALAADVSEDRAGSLQFRLTNEDTLLDRAFLKPLTGWGTYGRNRIYDQSGRDLSVTDGAWILTLARSGWPGYLAFYGLLTLPVMGLLFARADLRRSPETIALAVMGTGNLIYLIPNSTLSPVGLLAFGALAGSLSYRSVGTSDPAVGRTGKRQHRPRRYTRDVFREDPV